MAEAKIEPVAAEEPESVKALLSVIAALGDSMSQADRAKYEKLIELARQQSKA